MGLDALFVTSGFLVTASLVKRGDLISFFWARALRVYPALWVMLVLTVFVLAPALTTLTLRDYFPSPTTWTYFYKCATLIAGIRYSLPGVFTTLPLKGEFNSSLWTMPVEVRMYLYVAVLWVAFAILPMLRLKAMRIVQAFAAALFLVLVLRGRLAGGDFNGANIRVFMYLYGSALFLWRDKIPMSPGLIVALLTALVAATADRSVFLAVYLLALPPLVLHLAYVPGGAIRAYNKWGDYSYGVYIYAFPIQQTLAYLFPRMPLAGMMAASAFLSCSIAVVSWRLIEKRALAMKDDCAEATERGLSRALAKLTALAARLPLVRGLGLAAPAPATVRAGEALEAAPRPGD